MEIIVRTPDAMTVSFKGDSLKAIRGCSEPAILVVKDGDDVKGEFANWCYWIVKE